MAGFNYSKLKKLLEEKDIYIKDYTEEIVDLDTPDPMIEITVYRKSVTITGFSKEYLDHVTELGLANNLERTLDEFDLKCVLKNMFKNNPQFVDHNLKLTIKEVKKQIEDEK
jgi:hypothetical protein